MDPTETHRRCCMLAKNIINPVGGIPDEADAEELAMMFLSLNIWIINGGFLPQPWEGSASAQVA